MKFCEKLQMLRKEKGYSQETLADLLDVSRQAVSKWESGTTYPEMDKLLAICKIFNVTLDDLTNDDVSKRNLEKQKKNNFSNLVYTIIEMFEKTIEIFKNMNSKEIGKFIFDFCLLIVILLLCKLPFNYIDNLINNLFSSLNINYTIGNIFYNISSFVIDVIYFIFFITILIYFYKSRYLDKWEIKEEEFVVINKVKTEEVKENRKTKERNFVLFDILGSLVNFLIKLILAFTLLCLSLIFIIVVFALVLNIIASFKGIYSIGLIIIVGSLILGVGILLNLNIAWLSNHRMHYKTLLITFFLSLILFASGSALFSYEITSYSFIDSAPSNVNKKEETYTFKMNDTTYLNDYDYDGHNSYNRNLTFKVNDSLINEIKYHVSYYSDFQEIFVNDSASNTIYTDYSYSFHNPKIMDIIIQNIKDKTLYDYDKLKTIDIVVETSAKNIETLKRNALNNEKKWYEQELESIEENYQKEIDNLNRENERLEEEKNNYIERVDELESKINELEDTLLNK